LARSARRGPRHRQGRRAAAARPPASAPRGRDARRADGEALRARGVRGARGSREPRRAAGRLRRRRRRAPARRSRPPRADGRMTRALAEVHRNAAAIRALKERHPITPGDVDAFLASHSFPLVEGGTCTFVWRGEADAVTLKHWIFGLPQMQSFTRLPGTDLWYLVIELPPRSRVEYKLEVSHPGERRWIEARLNPMRARDPFGANSVAYGEGYEVPEWVLPNPETRPGRIEWRSLASRALGRPATLGIYLPARFRPTRRYPLLVVH